MFLCRIYIFISKYIELISTTPICGSAIRRHEIIESDLL